MNPNVSEHTAERPSAATVFTAGGHNEVAQAPSSALAIPSNGDPFFRVGYAVALGCNTFAIPEAERGRDNKPA